jgi:hypothetical protein
MLRMAVAVVAVLGLASGASGKDPVTFPKGQSPQFVKVVGLDAGKTALRVHYAVMVPVVTPVRVPVDNGTRFEVRKVTKYRQVVEEQLISLKGLRAVTAGGKKVGGAKGWKALEGKIVALVRGSEGLDPAYVKLLAKDTVILTAEWPTPRKP